MVSSNPLAVVKSNIGPLAWIQLESTSISAAHRRLGELVSLQVNRILERRLRRLSPAAFEAALDRTRRLRKVIERKVRSRKTPFLIRNALQEYHNCLDSWSQGAQLGTLRSWGVGDPSLSSFELALWLQDEYSGCQTGALRQEDGSALLWHTEEDAEEFPGERFDRLRMVIYEIEDCRVFSFIYPDLLPGSAFNWRSDRFFQAVDALFLRPDARRGSMLANIAAWIVLRLGRQMNPQEVIHHLTPFADGYALINAWPDSGRIQVQRTEFAGNQLLVTPLPDTPGSALFQVNIFSDPQSSLSINHEDLNRATRIAYLQRLERTELALRQIRSMPNAFQEVFRLLCSQEGADFAYANKDVKAHLALQLSTSTMEIHVGSGPAISACDAERLRF